MGDSATSSEVMTVVIAGGNGFVGSNLARGLRAAGRRVIVLVRQDADQHRLADWADGAGPAGEVVTTDYSHESLERLFKEHRPAAVINSVGYGLDARQRDLEVAFQTNIRVALDIADNAARVGADVIHLGSAYEYATSDAPIGEYVNISPQSFYGITKASASLLLRLQARELGHRLLIVRPFGIYGPGEIASKFIPAVISACRSNTSVNLSDGSKVRDYTFIDDVVRAIDVILSSNTDWPEATNLGSGRPVRLRYLVAKVCQLMDADPALFQWGKLPARNGDPAHLVADASLMNRLFDWRADISLDEGLSKTIQAFQPKA